MEIKTLIKSLKKNAPETRVYTYDPEEWIVPIVEVEVKTISKYDYTTKKMKKEKIIYLVTWSNDMKKK